jgi:type IV secretory pathway VirB10-like protein
MGRLLTGLGGALGLAWLWRFLTREHAQQQQPPRHDPAEELRAKLAQAREAADDRDEFDAAEGQPVDEVERPRPATEPEPEPETPTEEQAPLSLDERRRAIHEKAQQALGEMNRPGRDD